MKEYITISDVCYSYDQVSALNNFTINIKKNELYGVIGPDGAGKTTLFRLLATLLIPQKGEIRYEGIDIVKEFRAIRKKVGYMPGRFSLYHDLSVEENLEFFASVFKTTIQENYHLIKDIYQLLEPFKKRRVGKLSGGMKQKLALSCALVHKPEILILDEPTTGVDAVSRREFWDMLFNLKKMGITIIVSTPYMDEAKRCDRVALIKDGLILKTDTPNNIEKQFKHPLYAVRHSHNNRVLHELRKDKRILNLYFFGQEIHVVLKEEDTMNDIINNLNKQGYNDVWFDEVLPTIEDCFIQQMLQKEDLNAT